MNIQQVVGMNLHYRPAVTLLESHGFVGRGLFLGIADGLFALGGGLGGLGLECLLGLDRCLGGLGFGGLLDRCNCLWLFDNLFLALAVAVRARLVARFT